MSKYVRAAKVADAVSKYLRECGLKPEIRSDFSVEVEIRGLRFVVVQSLAEARRVVES